MTINRQSDLSPGNGIRRDTPLDVELQADPEMQEGPASAGRIAVYAVAAVVLLGAVFYGLNNSQSQAPNTAASTSSAPPAAATADNSGTNSPPIRNVTPNRDSGTTTGAAPAQSTPPQANPTGTEVDRSKGATTR